MPDESKNPLSKHPEAVYNGRGYFNFETNRIPEEVVPRGDVYQVNPNPYDLTPQDIIGLAAYAVTLVDPVIRESNPAGAVEDALLMAARTKDGGKYDGKISYNTGTVISSLIEDLLGKKRTASDNDTEKEAKKKDTKEKVVTIQKPGKKPEIGKDQISVKPGTGGKKVVLDVGKDPVLRKMLTKCASELDVIANDLERSGDPELARLAMELDVISNTLEVEDGDLD